MKKTSITGRVTAGLLLIALFFGGQTAFVWWMAEQSKLHVTDLIGKNTRGAAQLAELAVLAQQIRRYEKEYFVYVDNPERRAGYEKEWSGTFDKISKSMDTMQRNEGGEWKSQDLQKARGWQAAADFYGSEMRNVFTDVAVQAGRVSRSAQEAGAAPQLPAPQPLSASARPAGSVVAATAAATPAVPAAATVRMFTAGEVNDMIKAGKDRFSNDLIKGVAALQAEKTNATLALAATARDGFQQLAIGLSVVGAIGALIALVLANRLPRSILQPVNVLTHAVEKISLGEPQPSLAGLQVREFVQLSRAIERMRVAQEAMVERMRARPAKGEMPALRASASQEA